MRFSSGFHGSLGKSVLSCAKTPRPTDRSLADEQAQIEIGNSQPVKARKFLVLLIGRIPSYEYTYACETLEGILGGPWEALEHAGKNLGGPWNAPGMREQAFQAPRRRLGATEDFRI